MKKVVSLFVVTVFACASSAITAQEATVTLGRYHSAAQYQKALLAAGFDISPSAEAMLHQVRTAQARVSVDIVVVSQRELGLSNPAPPSAVFAAARARGLELCDPEVALALRLALPPENFQWLDIAMSPLDMNGIPGLFIVGAASGSGGLYASGARAPNLPQMKWVFTKSR